MDEIFFCTKCFASECDGSWGHTCADGHCFNCGAGGTTIRIPEWAVKFIRENASWVGKRFYPSDEDYENHKIKECCRKILRDQTVDVPDVDSVRKIFEKYSVFKDGQIVSLLEA